MKDEKGQLRYTFKSQGQMLKQGVTRPLSRRHLGARNGHDLIVVLVFDLPFPNARNNLTLTLEVVTPFDFLNKYKEKIRCFINPDYEFKVDGCYHEGLHI